MQGKLHLPFLLALSLVCPSGTRAQSPSDSQLLASIAAPGFWAESMPDFSALYKNPGRAAALLVAHLQPVDRNVYRSAPAVVWYIRALRSLTGLDFRGHTDSVLAEDENMGGGEKGRLHPDSQGNVLFFGTWMSRDLTWVAPRDAQVRIIEEWRTWLRTNAARFRYVNDTTSDHWYF